MHLGLGALRGIHASLKIKPHAGERLSVSHCSDNRKCRLPLLLIEVMIEKASMQKYQETPEQTGRSPEPLTPQQKTRRNRFPPPPLQPQTIHPKSSGSDLCDKLRLRQQGILRTISELNACARLGFPHQMGYFLCFFSTLPRQLQICQELCTSRMAFCVPEAKSLGERTRVALRKT